MIGLDISTQQFDYKKVSFQNWADLIKKYPEHHTFVDEFTIPQLVKNDGQKKVDLWTKNTTLNSTVHKRLIPMQKQKPIESNSKLIKSEVDVGNWS